MKVVIDTNVVVSSIFFGGKPKEIVNLILDKKIDAYANKEIIEEYKETVDYLKNKYNGKRSNVPLQEIISYINIIETNSNIKICRDPDDDKFINCAIDSKSYYIVSGDKDLLVLKRYENIEVITISEFLKLLK